MPIDLNKLRQRLEALTAESCPADALQDEESAGLRAAWLAFGALLEENRAELELEAETTGRQDKQRLQYNETLLPARVQASPDSYFLASSADSRLTGNGRPRPSASKHFLGGRAWLLAALSAAACVVLALAIGRHVRATKPATAPTPEQIAVKAAPSRHPTPLQAGPVASASRAADWNWDDSADQAIDQLGRATIQVEQDELASTAGSGSILDEFEAVGKGAADRDVSF